MIQLKSEREIEVMAEGGRILAATLEVLRRAVAPGISTGDLDQIAGDFVASHAGAQTAPVITWFRAHGANVRTVDAVGTLDEVEARALAAIGR